MTVAPPITAHPLHVVVASAGALGGAALGAEAAAGDRGAGGGQRLHGHVAAWTREHVNTADTCFVVVRCGRYKYLLPRDCLHVDISTRARNKPLAKFSQTHTEKAPTPTRANILKAARPL